MNARDPSTDNGPLPDSYVRWRSSPLGRITDLLEEQLLLELIGDPTGLDVLDVGCGDGMLMRSLARRGARMVGLDSDPRMLRAAAGRVDSLTGPMRFARARAQALPFADDSFDRVVAVAVLCFVSDADRAIHEMARVLRPAGRLVLGELGPWGIWTAFRRVRGWMGHPIWSNVRYRSARVLSALLEAQGLEVTTRRGAIFYPPLASIAHAMRRIDPWLGRRATLGATFVAVAGTAATRPSGNDQIASRTAA